MTRPLIAIDVDGVLNPYNMSNSRAKALGFQLSKRIRADRMIRTYWNRAHGDRLLNLSAEHDAELVWATYWGPLANSHARHEIGLPNLPVLDLDPATLSSEWKYPTMLEFAGARPLVWFDDEHRTHAAKRDRFLHLRHAPTKLIDVPCTEGIGHRQIEIAERFLESL